MPTSKSTFRVRAWARPWLVASITTLSLPAATISASSACSSSASGVVLRFSLADRSSPMPTSTVPISPGRQPAARSMASARKAVVVLPSVPVMPITCRRRDGWSYQASAASARASRERATTSCGICQAGQLVFHHDRQRPARDRLRHVVMAVHVDARDGEEERARLDRPRVVGQAADLAHRQADHPLRPDLVGQLPERHAPRLAHRSVGRTRATSVRTFASPALGHPAHAVQGRDRRRCPTCRPRPPAVRRSPS